MGLVERMFDRAFGYEVKYLGGHPAIDKPCLGRLSIKENGIEFRAAFGNRRFEVPYTEITGISVETEKTISTIKTVAKWMVSPAWGLISGLKGKKEFFLKVDFKDATGFESEILFQCRAANEVRARIVSQRYKSLSAH